MPQDEKPAIRHSHGDGTFKPPPRLQSRFRFAGTTTETQLTEAIAKAPHRYLGLKAAGSGKLSAVFPINNRTIESTDQTIGQCMQWWPGVTDWTLCGSDLLYDQQHTDSAHLPPEAQLFHSPTDLLTFSADSMRRQP